MFEKITKLQQGGIASLIIDSSLSDNKKMVKSAIAPKIQSQADWTKSYINSPMYKDRLTKQAMTERALIRQENPNPYSIPGSHYNNDTVFEGQRTIWNPATAAKNVISHQNQQLNHLLDGNIKVGNFQLSGGMGGAAEYDPFNDRINMKENIAASDAGNLIPAHEISHGINKARAPYSTDFRERFIDGKVLRPLGTGGGDPYVQTPTEVKARLDAMRYQMKQGGYYDAGTQKFDTKALQNLKNDPKIVNDVNYQTLSKELPQGRKDESLMWLFNNIAQNKTTNSSIQYSQQGGTLAIQSAPKNWMVNYMDSNLYKQRLAKMGNKPITNDQRQALLNTNIVLSDFDGTRLVRKSEVNFVTTPIVRSIYGVKEGLFKRDVPNILIHPNVEKEVSNSYKIQDKSLSGLSLPKDIVLAHELSHAQRTLNNTETKFINKLVRPDTYKNSHDSLADEQKADLDAVRYYMFKKNIYDPSKRNMTMDDFNKANADKEISGSFNFQRLLKSFKPENVIEFNNKIAKTRNINENSIV